ncbi:oligosaccharide flippase family protein [Patescibacteria group bacterium]|nr:oligosaccharide flippase family protein [Patescibacteria group bacterium]MBU2461084.1 oligosaccharide flippase family protein [Patescibacteria group bacterium]
MLKNIRVKIYKLLRWSEAHTKTDMVYLAKGGFWLTLGQIISSASTFLLAIAFANLLPKETYGSYKYILSIASILAIPTLSGMNTAITQAVSRGYEGSLIPALKTKIRWGLFGALASLMLAGYYYFNNNTTLTISFLIISVFLPFMDSFSVYGSLLVGKKQFKISTKYQIISQITAITILIITLCFTQNLFFVLLAYFIPWTFLRFIFLKITLKKFRPNSQQDPQTIPYGKHLSLIGILGAVATHIDKILLFHYLGVAELAIYAFAIAPIEQIKGLFKNLPALALPKLARRSFHEIDSILYKRLFLLFFIGSCMALMYIFFAPYFFKIFFPKYLDSIFFSQIFGISIMLTAPIALLNAIGNSKLIYTPKKMLYEVTIIPQIILIASLLTLVPIFGIIGVIISKILFLFFILILDLIYWKKIIRFNSQKNIYNKI